MNEMRKEESFNLYNKKIEVGSIEKLKIGTNL